MAKCEAFFAGWSMRSALFSIGLAVVAASSGARAQVDPFGLPGTTQPAARPRSAAPSPQVVAKPSAPKPAAPASAAPAVKGPPIGTPMTVALVRGGKVGCSTDCREWIMAEGQIDKTTVPLFKKVLKSIGTRKVPILISSGGGMVDEAIEIGRLIRAKGLDVAVARSTTVRGCAAGDVACKPDINRDILMPRAHMAYCASSCAFILAAGTNRYAGTKTLVGVHQIASFKTTAQILQKFRILTRPSWSGPVEVKRELISEKRVNEKTVRTETPDSAYRMIAKYFAEMGVTEAVMPMIKSTPNTSMHWLTARERTTTRLVTVAIDGEELLTGVASHVRPVRPVDPAPVTSSVDVLKADVFKSDALKVDAFKSMTLSPPSTTPCPAPVGVTCAATQPQPGASKSK
jgi:hypothetical protein